MEFSEETWIFLLLRLLDRLLLWKHRPDLLGDLRLLLKSFESRLHLASLYPEIVPSFDHLLKPAIRYPVARCFLFSVFRAVRFGRRLLRRLGLCFCWLFRLSLNPRFLINVFRGFRLFLHVNNVVICVKKRRKPCMCVFI